MADRLSLTGRVGSLGAPSPRRAGLPERLEQRTLYSASWAPASFARSYAQSTQFIQARASNPPFAAASAPSHHAVPAATTTALRESVPVMQIGQTVTFTAIVSASKSATPTGVVTFNDGSIVLATTTLDRGSASITIATLSAGSHSIQAAYSGNALCLGSTSQSLVEIVTPAPTPAVSPPPPVPPIVVSQPVAVWPPSLPGNWNLTFDDEFNGSALGPVWVPHQYWSTGATAGEGQETSIPANVTESGGTLNLAATSATQGALVQSGGIQGQSLPSESFTYGYIEARILVPQGANTTGLWPAFWLMPQATITTGVNHDSEGEIDVMDNGLGNPAAMHGGVHIGSAQAQSAGPTLSPGWHTIGLDWEKTGITWYIDGVAWYTESTLIPTGAEYPIFDLAVNDGSWGPPPNSSTQFPATMQVDWIHIWQQT